MAGIHFVIATPDAPALDQLDLTFVSVAGQSGNISLTYLANDPDNALGIATRLPAWRSEAQRLRGPAQPLTIVLSHHAGLGDFDTLDRMLVDVPNSADTVLVSLPCGCSLAPGALDIVARVMRDQPAIGLIRGLATVFGPNGVVTGLNFESGGATWDVIGAVADKTRDQRDLPGGLFWRSILWYRLGRMDPALIYAGYVDLCSKAAIHAQIGQVEAVLVRDRHRLLTAEDTALQVAEFVRVQSRAARRQLRLHERLSNGRAEFEEIGPPVRFAYDSGSRQWHLKEPPQFLDPFGRAEIESGFMDLEGPYPDAALPHRFRWTTASRASFSVVADCGSHKIEMRLRNPSVGQSVSLELNGEVVFAARPATASLADFLDVNVVCELRQGRNRLAIVANVMLIDAAGQSLGVIVESVDIARTNG